tara:strand:- start:132975 stop:133931 length:957 start_codon:yes stop_codon:yes gene_type:complete
MKKNKKWISFEDQLDTLKSRGLVVDNEAAALDYLERIGYYRLSGYWYSFRELKPGIDNTAESSDRRLDTFQHGSHFKDGVDLYVFDKKLRLLALDALERIELAVRVDIAYLLGKQDAYAHENAEVFHGNFTKVKKNGKQPAHQDWLEKYHSLVQRARREPFVKHYMDKYGKLPIWVAIEIWDFGLLSKVFAGLKHEHKEIIASKYGAKNGKAFASWLRGLNFIRNVAAHHSRLWNINVLERSADIQDDKFWKQLNNARPYFYFCLMKRLLDVICPNSNWSSRFSTLLDEFPRIESGAVSLADFGLIEKRGEWALWEQK